MPLNQKKILSIIADEVEMIPEREEGYSKDILKAVSEIISLEIHHKVSAINIQQRINELLNETAAKHSNSSATTGEVSN